MVESKILIHNVCVAHWRVRRAVQARHVPVSLAARARRARAFGHWGAYGWHCLDKARTSRLHQRAGPGRGARRQRGNGCCRRRWGSPLGRPSSVVAQAGKVPPLDRPLRHLQHHGGQLQVAQRAPVAQRVLRSRATSELRRAARPEPGKRRAGQQKPGGHVAPAPPRPLR